MITKEQKEKGSFHPESSFPSLLSSDFCVPSLPFTLSSNKMNRFSNTDAVLGHPNQGNSSNLGKEETKMEQNEDEKQVQVGDSVKQEDIHLEGNSLQVWVGRTMLGIMQGFELISLRPQYPYLGPLPHQYRFYHRNLD